MCQMENCYLSPGLKAVSFNMNDSWAAKSLASTHSFQQDRARFQQKQLQEKEEKLVKLYEEQQERALKSVGSRSQSGGSSVSSSSSVGAGKVRHMFQSRRENSEPRLGRDKSHPLEPLSKCPSNNRFSTSQTPAPHRRTVSLDRNNLDFPRERNENHYDLESDENYNWKKIGLRRTESQARKPHRDFVRFDHGRSFQLVDDDFENFERNEFDDYFLTSFNAKRQFYENRGKSEKDNDRVRSKLPEKSEGMEGRYKSYVSQSFGKKPHLGALPGRTGAAPRPTPQPKETNSSGYLNGSVSSPVRKIRKPTPVPLSVTPPQHLLQKERKTTKIETIREVPVSSAKTPAPRIQPSTGSFQKPPTPGKVLPSTRTSLTKPSSQPPSVTKSAPPSDLVNCRTCGRHFAADRVSKHEEVCQKFLKSKRKPFDALQQRVKGTEVEQFIKKSSRSSRAQPEKVAKPQSNWRKKHEEFINNIRAAKEVTAHLKKGGKLSDLPPPPPSDYSDYVPCPHCGRKFNNSAAERHIPKCANIINNKPKANLQKNPGLKQTSKLLHTSVRGRK